MEEHRTSVSDPAKSSLPVTDGNTKALNLSYSNAAVLSYIPIFGVNVIFSLIFLATEPSSSKYVRFHALQSLMLFGSSIAFCFASMLGGILAIIPIIGPLIAFGLGAVATLYCFAAFCVSIFLAVKANQCEMYELPVIGFYANRYSSQ